MEISCKQQTFPSAAATEQVKKAATEAVQKVEASETVEVPTEGIRSKL